MSAAAFVLAINLSVAGLFVAAFVVTAAYARSAAARWFAAAYGIGMVDAGLEFVLPYQADPRPVGFGIFAAFLFALNFCVIGLSRHYRLPLPRRVLGAITLISLIVGSFIIGLPRESFLRAMLYQLPYVATLIAGIWVIARLPQRRSLDTALMVLYGFGALQFLSKPFLAALIGSGASPQGYLGSAYAAYSQTGGAFILVANGILTLLIILRDVMAEITARSETDTLSGLFNRRGFEDRADRALGLAAGAMVVADLDYFKQINDSFGHEAGDRVIAAFAEVLRGAGPVQAPAGRLGGEEFAVFLPGASAMEAWRFAEKVRNGFAGLALLELPPERKLSASFGIAASRPDDSLADLLRRSDAALYEAKKAGRDCIRLAVADETDMDGPISAAGGA